MGDGGGNDAGRDDAVPGVDPRDDGQPGPVLQTVEVEGESFVIRRSSDGGSHYDWVSGPNRDYGFSSSGPEQSEEEHRQSIRSFLSMIDPLTGYIAED